MMGVGSALAKSVPWGTPFAVMAILDDPSEQKLVMALCGVVIVGTMLFKTMLERKQAAKAGSAQSARCALDHQNLHELVEGHVRASIQGESVVALLRQQMTNHHEQEVDLLKGILDAQKAHATAQQETNRQLAQLVFWISSQSKNGNKG